MVACPHCGAAVYDVHWQTSSSGKKHIKALCCVHGHVWIKQTWSNIYAANRAEDEKRRKFKTLADLGTWGIA